MQPDTTRIRARSEEKFPRVRPVSEKELDHPRLRTITKLIWNSVARLFHDPVGMILGSAFLLIMLWGHLGKLELLGLVWDGWKGPGVDSAAGGRILPGIPWDQEWVSFWAGALLLVAVPAILIRRVYRQDLREYGLGLPASDRWGLTGLSSVVLLLVSLPAFYLGAKNPAMQATYPLFRDFEGLGQFFVYQLGYLPFFLAIEFIFRGYLLFGLFHVKDRGAPPGVTGVSGPLVFGYYAIFISMLAYTAWHLGKPAPELWGTLVWGIAAGSVALACGTIWHLVFIHWLLNVFMDWVIWSGWSLT